MITGKPNLPNSSICVTTFLNNGPALFRNVIQRKAKLQILSVIILRVKRVKNFSFYVLWMPGEKVVLFLIWAYIFIQFQLFVKLLITFFGSYLLSKKRIYYPDMLRTEMQTIMQRKQGVVAVTQLYITKS